MLFVNIKLGNLGGNQFLATRIFSISETTGYERLGWLKHRFNKHLSSLKFWKMYGWQFFRQSYISVIDNTHNDIHICKASLHMQYIQRVPLM